MFYTNVDKNWDEILYRGYDENGKQFFMKEHFDPTIYIPTKTETRYQTLHGEYLQPHKTGSMKELSNFIKKYKEVDNFRFYGMEKPIYNFIAEKFPGEIKYDFNKIRIGYIDIETECENGFPDIIQANEEVTIINIFFRGKYYLFTSKKWGTYETTRPDIVNVVCQDEKEMFKKFMDFWIKANLDIVSGWYSEGFDMVFLINRMINLFGMDFAKKLSPWGILRKKELPIKGRTLQVYEIVGVNHLDYKDLDGKFSGKVRENGKLDTVANDELGLGKLDYSVYGSLYNMYKSDWTAFVDYNIRDVEILPNLEEKMKLIELACYITYYSGTNMIDTFKNTRVWDQIIYRHLLAKNVIVPQREKDGDDRPFGGGYVKEPIKGLREWVVNFDLNSLYPSLIMQYNISPETEMGREDINFDLLLDGNDTQIKYLKEKNYSVCANGVYFTKEKRGFLPELMENLYAERSQNKKEMLVAERRAQEIREEIARRG